MLRRLVVLAVSMSLVLAPITAASTQAPTIFKKLDFYTQEGEEMKDHDAQLIIDVQRRLFIFADEDHADRVFATVSWDRITGVSYENSKHSRITAGLLIAWPMLFMKGKKHWLTMTYRPEANGSPGGYAFARMDKDNFQNILAAINGFTGFEIRRIEEDGEISVLYPGAPAAQAEAVAPANAAAPAASSTPSSGSSPSVAAGALPPSNNEIAAGALPPKTGGIPAGPLPPAAPRIQPMALLNQGVQWTQRTPTAVGYVWAVEVGNDNSVALDATVVLKLYDAAGATLHEAREAVTVPPTDVFAFTANGEVPEAQALQADHWDFDIEMAATSTPEPAPAARTADRARSITPAATASPPTSPAPLVEPVPLTDNMVKPVLVRDSVTIVTDNSALQQINLAGARITIRCLVRADGSVADARVFRTRQSASAGLRHRSWRKRCRSSTRVSIDCRGRG